MKPIHYLTIIFFVMLGVLNASDANAQSLTYTTTETSLMSSVATNSDNPATLTYTLEETEKYTRITIEMNDFAAQNLYGIYISTTLYEADGSTSFAISGAKDEDSNFGLKKLKPITGMASSAVRVHLVGQTFLISLSTHRRRRFSI